jgi:type IV secretion system protein VirB6
MSGMFVGVERTIMDGVTTALGGQSEIYGNLIAPSLIAWATLYVCISGYRTLAGKLQTPLADVLWNLAIIGMIYAFVVNADGWFSLVESAIDGVRTGFSGNSDGIWGQLDSLWESSQNLAERLSQLDDSYTQINGAMAKLLVWAGTGIVVFTAGVVNLAAEFTLKLLLTTGPLFIACLAWGWFRSMFENWMKAILSCLLTVLFSSLSLGVVLKMMNTALVKAAAGAPEASITTTAVMILGVGIMGAVVVVLSAKIATALSGSGVSATVAGMGLGAAAGAGYMGYRKLNSGSSENKKSSENKTSSTQENASGNLNRTDKQRAMQKAAVDKMKSLNR